MAWKKRFFPLLIFCVTFHHPIFGQDTTQSTSYAVVIGITQYQNASLSTLQFADKDAALFAAHLQSKEGGNVPIDNIRLLQNENATIAAVYDALNWLQDRCTSNDKAYFYFSGHGDVETQNSFSLGYLLAYNSPASNYRNNAITIEDLNKMANHLSVNSNATVVLVTDACHTGKLAGDYYKGKQLVASQLQLILNNEIRLAACGADEKAAEGEDWGGGRGVFSYYLLKGLNGMADLNRNDTIQLRELNTYLDSAFTVDKVLINNAHKQHPVLDGNPYQVMALVDSAVVADTKKSAAEPAAGTQVQSALRVFKPLGLQPIDYFFGWIKSRAIASKLPFLEYRKLPKDSLPVKIVRACIAYQQQSNKKVDSLEKLQLEGGEYFSLASSDSLLRLLDQLSHSKPVVNSFNERFIQLVHSQAQDMINAYLEGDLAELEKRQYYYAGDRQYGDFINMLRVALQITPRQHYLYQLLTVQEAYISGLVARLEMVTAPEGSFLLADALRYQQRALALEPYAAYIHNELGNLYLTSKKFALADQHFKTAQELSPTWAIPWGNQIRLGLATKDQKKVTQAIEMADSLQPELSYIYMNAGLAKAQQGDLLAAESYFQKAITKNNIHFFPYEKLGNLYTGSGEYQKAEWFLQAASMRKKAYAINYKSFQYGVMMHKNTPLGPLDQSCEVFRIDQPPSLLPYVELVRSISMLSYRPDTAFKMMKRVATMNANLPLLHHYMGRILYGQKNWKDAEAPLLIALHSFLSDSAMVVLQAQLNAKYDVDTCLLVKLKEYQYDVLEDHYLLASVYEHLGAFEKAIEQYSIIMDMENDRQRDQAAKKAFYIPPGLAIMDPFEVRLKIAGYIKKANLYEKSADFILAEKTYLRQVQLNHEAGNIRKAKLKPGDIERFEGNGRRVYWLAVNQLAEAKTFQFYQRMLRLFPRDAGWQQKAGMFLYRQLLPSFQTLRVDQYKSLYESLSTYFWPFSSTEQERMGSQFFTNLPGTGEEIVFPLTRLDPVKESLENLNLALRLSGDLKPDVFILEAIADLHSWMGDQKLALEKYKELTEIGEPDASLRTKIIAYSVAVNESAFALDQLAILHRAGRASPAQNKQLAEWYALSGSTVNALDVLTKNAGNESEKGKPDLLLLQAKTNWLAGKPRKALSYLHSLPVTQADTVNQDSITKPLAGQYYSIARLNALMKRKKNAFSALKQALACGFAYGFVLENDIAWQRWRGSTRWKELNAQYSAQLHTTIIDPEKCLNCLLP